MSRPRRSIAVIAITTDRPRPIGLAPGRESGRDVRPGEILRQGVTGAVTGSAPVRALKQWPSFSTGGQAMKFHTRLFLPLVALCLSGTGSPSIAQSYTPPPSAHLAPAPAPAPIAPPPPQYRAPVYEAPTYYPRTYYPGDYYPQTYYRGN
jgi:hypothetical protein